MRPADSNPSHRAHPNARPSEPKAPRFRSAQRLALLSFVVAGSASLLGLAGCPGNLDNPERFNVDMPSAGDNAGGGPTKPGLNVDTTCLMAAFATSCATATICHKAGAIAGAGLDLESAGVNQRLIDVPATHTGTTLTTDCKMGDKLIDSANPAASWLGIKLTPAVGKCGSQMPIGTISDADLACINKYIQDVGAAAQASGSGGAAAATGGAAAATGGAAAATGGSGGGT